jgi:hypothetical protein
MPDEPKPAPSNDAAISHAGPAIYANRVMIEIGPVVRLTFMEMPTPPDTQNQFRVAVALPHATAIELANLLKGMLADVEKQLEAFKAEAEKAAATADKKDGQ